MRNNEIKINYLFNEIKKWEQKIERSDLKHEAKNTCIIFKNLKH